MPLPTRVFSNQDLQVCIPEIVMSDVRVTDRTIPLSEIEIPNEDMRELLPQEGVRVEFGGSLKILNTTDFSTKTEPFFNLSGSVLSIHPLIEVHLNVRRIIAISAIAHRIIFSFCLRSFED